MAAIARWVVLAASFTLATLTPIGHLGLTPIGHLGHATAAPAGAASPATAAQQAYDRAVYDLLVLERRLASAQERLTDAQEEAAATADDLATARGLQAAAAADLARLEERRGDRLRAIYMSRGGGWLEVMVESADLGELLDRMFLLGRIVRQECDLARQVSEAQTAAAAAAARLQEAQTEQRARVAELAAREAELRDARAAQQALISRLGERLAEAREAAAAARARMEKLNAQARGGGGRTEAAPVTGGGAESMDGGSGSTGGAGGGSGRGGGSSGGGASADQRPAGRQLRVKATAYALPGTTATGVGVRRGIVAVDPRVIPLGTRLWIPGYGEGLAADTGGDIKGNWIDVWLPTEREALDWGVKYVTITILD